MSSDLKFLQPSYLTTYLNSIQVHLNHSEKFLVLMKMFQLVSLLIFFPSFCFDLFLYNCNFFGFLSVLRRVKRFDPPLSLYCMFFKLWNFLLSHIILYRIYAG